MKKSWFFSSLPFVYPFTLFVLFCKKYLNYTYFHSFTPVKAFKSTLTLFKGHFVKIMNFCPNSFNLSDFATQIFEGMYFFIFLPFFGYIYEKWSKSMILLTPSNFWAKRVKKGAVLILVKKCWKFQNFIFSENCPI